MKFRLINEEEAQKIRFERWIEAQQRPYAKLMRGFYKIDALVDLLDRNGFDYTAFYKGPNFCEGIVFTFKSIVHSHDFMRDNQKRNGAFAEAEEACHVGRALTESLRALKCPVIFPGKDAHKSTIHDPRSSGGLSADKQAVYKQLGIPIENELGARDYYLFMPFDKPNESYRRHVTRLRKRGLPPQPRVMPNFEAKVTFLAYLIAKGYVTEADAPRGEDPRAPFSAAMFGFAKARAQELSL